MSSMKTTYDLIPSIVFYVPRGSQNKIPVFQRSSDSKHDLRLWNHKFQQDENYIWFKPIACCVMFRGVWGNKIPVFPWSSDPKKISDFGNTTLNIYIPVRQFITAWQLWQSVKNRLAFREASWQHNWHNQQFLTIPPTPLKAAFQKLFCTFSHWLIVVSPRLDGGGVLRGWGRGAGVGSWGPLL